jgi:hypothetical protein
VKNLCSSQKLHFGGSSSQSWHTWALSTDLVPWSFLILQLSSFINLSTLQWLAGDKVADMHMWYSADYTWFWWSNYPDRYFVCCSHNLYTHLLQGLDMKPKSSSHIKKPICQQYHSMIHTKPCLISQLFAPQTHYKWVSLTGFRSLSNWRTNSTACVQIFFILNKPTLPALCFLHENSIFNHLYIYITVSLLTPPALMPSSTSQTRS